MTILKLHCRKHDLKYNESMIAFQRIATLDHPTYYSKKKSKAQKIPDFLKFVILPRYDTMYSEKHMFY